jgi:hypothetical protein
MWIGFCLVSFFCFIALRRVNEPKSNMGCFGRIEAFMGDIGLLLNAPYKIDSMVWMSRCG